jgi:electron transport complex protein RnfA
MEYIILIISALLIQNILLIQYLGNCPFVGVSKRMDTAVGMGFAVIFVMTIATAVTWMLQYHVLEKFGLGYLQTLAFILVIASLVQFVELFLKKSIPTLYQPLITTNCAVLGVAILAIRKEYDFAESLVYAVASSAGFMLALVLLAGIRERLDTSDIAPPLRGTAIALIMAGLMALAFLGFTGVDASLKALMQQ